MKKPSKYRSYLLRLWQEGSGEPPLWRASLESPRSDDQRGFASLTELFTFLQKEVGQAQMGSNAGEKGGDIDGLCPD